VERNGECAAVVVVVVVVRRQQRRRHHRYTQSVWYDLFGKRTHGVVLKALQRERG